MYIHVCMYIYIYKEIYTYTIYMCICIYIHKGMYVWAAQHTFTSCCCPIPIPASAQHSPALPSTAQHSKPPQQRPPALAKVLGASGQMTILYDSTQIYNDIYIYIVLYIYMYIGFQNGCVTYATGYLIYSPGLCWTSFWSPLWSDPELGTKRPCSKIVSSLGCSAIIIVHVYIYICIY